MANRQTTWELKAIDNLPELIARMQQIIALQQQQAQISLSSNSAILGQLANISTGYRSVQTSLQQVTTATQQAANAATQQQAATQKVQQQMDSMRGTVSLLTSAIAGVFTVSKAQEFIKDVVLAESKVTLFNKSLETILQSKKLADEISAYALAMAARSPFEVKQIIEVTQKLAAMGAEGSKITTYLEALGEIASVVGTQKLPLIAKALLDVQNKQVLYAQEVRQFTDNGVPLYQLLADSMNKPVAAVKKLAEEHKIRFAEVEKALLDATTTGGKYHGMMAMQAETNAGKLSNLTDVIYLAKARFGEFAKDGIGKVISELTDFIKETVGTNAAMEKTLNVVKSVTAAVITFTTTSRAAAVAVAAKEVVMKAYTIAVGTSQIAMQALTSATGANITITTAAATTARAFWATLAANPIGLIITAIGLATSAYYAFQAANTDTTVVIDAATESLLKEKVQLTAAVQAVQGYSIGTTERTKAVQSLMDKYPGLLGYIDADKVSNTLLNKALAEQIGLLDAKIKYAAAAAQADAMYQKEVDLRKQQYEVIVNLRTAYKELSASFPDNDKFVAAVERAQKAEYDRAESLRNTSTAAMAASGSIVAFSGETEKYKNIATEVTGVQKQMALITTEVSKASSESTNAQVADIQRQLTALEAAHNTKKVTDEDYKAKRGELLNEIKRLNKEEVDDNESAQVAITKKRKEKKEENFFTAQQLEIVVKQVLAESLQDQLDLVEKKMKEEIAMVNTHKVAYVKTEEDAALAIEAIIIKANREKERLVKESSVEIEAKELAHKNNIVELANKMVSDVQLSEVQRLMNTQLTADERAAIELDTQIKIAEIRKREQEIIEETVVIEKNARKQQLAAIINFTGNMMPELQKFADFSLAILDNYDLVSGATTNFFKNQEIASKSAMDTTRSLYGENSVQFAQASENHAKSQKDLAEAQANASAATANVYMMLAQLVIDVMNSIADGISTSMDGIVDSLTATSEAFQNFTNVTVDMNRQMIEIVLDDTTKSFDDKKALIDDYIQYEKDTLYGNERLQNEINTAKNSVELAKWQAEQQGQFVRNLTHGVPKGVIENWRLVLTWRQEQTKKEEELARQQTIFEQNQAIQRAEQQIATYKAMADEKIRIAEETRDAEIAAQQATNEVIANELDVLDTKRKSLLDSWLERRLKDLEDDKNLALAQAATEEEKANIIIKYQGLMQAAHDEYKGAELDKTKSVKLATEELKAQEADFIKQKEGDTANTIRNINNQTTQMIRDANREIFEASKQITIAELQGEIAKLKAKRWFMNANRVDSAIATIEGVISQIQGTQFGGGNIGGGAPVDGDLGVNEGYQAAGQKAEDVANQAQRAMDATTKILQDALSTTDWLAKLQSEAQSSLQQIEDAKRKASEAEKYALGTEYVEGFGYPDGVDTVPAFVNKGERIIPTELNNLLGGRSLSNEELVQRQLFADRILGEIRGGMQVKTFFQMPDIMLNTAGVRQADLNSLAQQIVDAVGNSGPNINITASPYGMNIEEIGRDRQHKKYYNNQYYSLN